MSLSVQVLGEDIMKAHRDCPFSTSSSKDDQEVLGELRNFFQSFSNSPECSSMSAAGMRTVSELQSAMSAISSDEEKCLSKNVEQTKLRDLALAFVENGMEIGPSSPYSDCNSSSLSIITGSATSKDKVMGCIADKYQSSIQECKKGAASQSIQDKVAKGMGDLQKTLSQTLSSKVLCGPKMKEALKTAVDSFSKVKSVASILPWGAVAGVGVDLVGSTIDNYFPTDAKQASNMMDDLLNEESYERTSCLFFNIQQEMYCNDHSSVVSSDPRCAKDTSGNDLVKLVENIHEIKKAADVVATDGSSPKTGAVDTSYLEANIDDLIKYATASEEEVRSRIKTLPKVQQAKELEKIDNFYLQLKIYEYSNPDTSMGIEVGKTALERLMPLLYSTDPSERINFEQLILKATPGLKMDAIKQRGIVKALEDLQSANAEEGRRLVKFDRYKNNMNELAAAKMQSQLETKFDEFKKHFDLLSKNENGASDDLIGEGMLRNIVRHCVLMQEIYDPKIEGKIPNECAKLNCGNENRMNWFMPKEGQNNVSQFKKSYCDKSLNYMKIEDEYVKELKDRTGPKLCGAKISEFLNK
ncbi:MAG: hypothetical protein ACXVCE_16140 [Bacteriovorax sp.]